MLKPDLVDKEDKDIVRVYFDFARPEAELRDRKGVETIPTTVDLEDFGNVVEVLEGKDSKGSVVNHRGSFSQVKAPDRKEGVPGNFLGSVFRVSVVLFEVDSRMLMIFVLRKVFF